MIKLIDTNIYEVELLALLFNKPNCREIIMRKINKEHFTSSFNKRLFETIKELYEDNVPIDINTVISKMKNLNIYENGDFFLLNQINEAAPSEGALNFYLNNLLEAYKSNKAKKSMLNYLNVDSPLDLNVVINELEIINDIVEDGNSPQELQEKFLLDLEERVKSDTIKPFGILTGFRDLDSITRGIVKGSIVTVQARSGVGKTTFNLALSKYFAEKRHKVCYFSLEVTAEQFTFKLNLSHAAVETDEYLRITNKNDGLIDKLIEASNEVARFNLRVEEEINLDKILANIDYHIRKNNVNIFFIDYLNIIQVKTNNTNTDYVFNEITARLKQIAIKKGVIIFLVTQSNREIDRRENKRPTLADIKSSSSIEQNSDYIFALHRNIDFNSKATKDKLFREGKINYTCKDADYNPECFEVIVLKNRHTGECGTAALRFKNNRLKNW